MDYIYYARSGFPARIEYRELEGHLGLFKRTFYTPFNNGEFGLHTFKYGFNNITLTII